MEFGRDPKKSAFAQDSKRLKPARSDECEEESSSPKKASMAKLSASVQSSLPPLQFSSHDFDISYKPLQDGAMEISYQLPAGAKSVFLGLWNQLAFYVRTVVNGNNLNKGRQTVIWDGKDDAGNPVSEGVYICRVSVDGQHGGSQMVKLAASA